MAWITMLSHQSGACQGLAKRCEKKLLDPPRHCANTLSPSINNEQHSSTKQMMDVCWASTPSCTAGYLLLLYY